MRKTLSCSLCLLLLLFALGGTCSAATYTATEQEMQQLMSNSQRLSEINSYLQLNSADSVKTLLRVSDELRQSKIELQTLKAELAKLRENLQTARSLSQSQQDLLTKTNESFQQYSKEQKAAISELKRQKTAWQVFGFVALIVAGIK